MFIILTVHVHICVKPDGVILNCTINKCYNESVAAKLRVFFCVKTMTLHKRTMHVARLYVLFHVFPEDKTKNVSILFDIFTEE